MARRSRDGRSLRDLEVLTSFVVTRSTLGVWALPEVFCNTKAKLAINKQ